MLQNESDSCKFKWRNYWSQTTGHVKRYNYCVIMANWGAVTNVQELGICGTLTCAHFVRAIPCWTNRHGQIIQPITSTQILHGESHAKRKGNTWKTQNRNVTNNLVITLSKTKKIGRSCNELQSNLVMINHYVAFYHKIPNQNFMSIVKMKSMYVYRSYSNQVLMLPSLHHSMTKILNILFSRILNLFMGL